jgi:hypothetical protein
MPGPKHEVARGVAVCGVPHGSDPDRLHELLGRCEKATRRGLARGSSRAATRMTWSCSIRPPMSGTTMGNRRLGERGRPIPRHCDLAGVTGAP